MESLTSTTEGKRDEGLQEASREKNVILSSNACLAHNCQGRQKSQELWQLGTKEMITSEASGILGLRRDIRPK